MITTELIPNYTNQKSFYKKALVYTDGKGNFALQSYNTIVAVIVKDKMFRTWQGYSRTTQIHINEFTNQILNKDCFKTDYLNLPYVKFDYPLRVLNNFELQVKKENKMINL